MSDKQRLLLADTEEAIKMVKELISQEFELVTATSFSEAKRLLVDSDQPAQTLFSVVIAGMHFDDSRMMTLLEFIRSVDHLERLPFLPIKALATTLGVGDGLVKAAVQALGGCPLVILTGLDSARAKKVLGEAITSAIGRPVAEIRRDPGNSPHLEPEQFSTEP